MNHLAGNKRNVMNVKICGVPLYHLSGWLYIQTDLLVVVAVERFVVTPACALAHDRKVRKQALAH